MHLQSSLIFFSNLVLSTSCCLCRDLVGSDSRKKKRLHGPGCASAKELLQVLAGIALEKFPTFSDQKAVLCYGCEGILKCINKLEKDIVNIEEEVANKKGYIKRKISALSQKRPCSTDSADSLPKRGRTEVSSPIVSSTEDTATSATYQTEDSITTAKDANDEAEPQCHVKSSPNVEASKEYYIANC